MVGNFFKIIKQFKNVVLRLIWQNYACCLSTFKEILTKGSFSVGPGGCPEDADIKHWLLAKVNILCCEEYYSWI